MYWEIRFDRVPAGLDMYKGFMAVEAVERTTLAGAPKRLLILEVEADYWWTNLPSSVWWCIWLNRDHGTSEQFHCELKIDMGLELLHSGSLKTNALDLGLASFSFNGLRSNYLRFIEQGTLEREPATTDNRKRLAWHRLQTISLDYVKGVCKVAVNARWTLLKFGNNCFNFFIKKEIYAI